MLDNCALLIFLIYYFKLCIVFSISDMIAQHIISIWRMKVEWNVMNLYTKRILALSFQIQPNEFCSLFTFGTYVVCGLGSGWIIGGKAANKCHLNSNLEWTKWNCLGKMAPPDENRVNAHSYNSFSSGPGTTYLFKLLL